MVKSAEWTTTTARIGIDGPHDADRVVHLRDHLAAARLEVRQLRRAPTCARRIGAAIGILMATYKVTEEQAFDVLRHVSQTTHRKVRDVADDVVRTGELPRMSG